MRVSLLSDAGVSSCRECCAFRFLLCCAWARAWLACVRCTLALLRVGWWMGGWERCDETERVMEVARRLFLVHGRVFFCCCCCQDPGSACSSLHREREKREEGTASPFRTDCLYKVRSIHTMGSPPPPPPDESLLIISLFSTSSHDREQAALTFSASSSRPSDLAFRGRPTPRMPRSPLLD